MTSPTFPHPKEKKHIILNCLVILNLHIVISYIIGFLVCGFAVGFPYNLMILLCIFSFGYSRFWLNKWVTVKSQNLCFTSAKIHELVSSQVLNGIPTILIIQFNLDVFVMRELWHIGIPLNGFTVCYGYR